MLSQTSFNFSSKRFFGKKFDILTLILMQKSIILMKKK